METLDCIADVVETVKKSIDFRILQHGLHFRTEAGKAHVAVALHRFFKATQKKVNRRSIQFAYSRAIEYYRGPVNADAAFKVLINLLTLRSGDALRQFPDRD